MSRIPSSLYFPRLLYPVAYLSLRRGGAFLEGSFMLLNKTEEGPNVAGILPVKQWRAERASHVFKTDSAFEWFIKKHRERLVREGAYVVRGGRAEALCTEHMDRVVAEILIGTNTFEGDI